MITTFQGPTVAAVWSDAFGELYQIAEGGATAQSRDGAVVAEILDAAFYVEDPTRNIVTSPIRNMPMRYAIGELAWYLSGSDRVSDISQFAKKWTEISDDGIHNNSAYGHKIFEQYGFDQWELVKRLLTRDPNSRQAVVHIKNPVDYTEFPTKDVPCTVYLQFFLRDGKLHMTTHMRSNDIWMGVPYDMFSFCFMQMKMAMELGVEIGGYSHYAGSLHLYARDYEKAKENMRLLVPEANCAGGKKV